jgi:hypothetical protein
MDLNLDTWRTQRVPTSASEYLAWEARQPPPVVEPPPQPQPQPQPHPQPIPDDDLPPRNEKEERRFARQGKLLRVLAKMRGVATVGGVDHKHFYRYAAKLGNDAKLTELEYRQLKEVLGAFPFAWPEGYSRDQAKAIRDEVNRPLQTAAKRRRRQAERADEAARVQTVAVVHRRSSAIWSVLTYPRYQTVRELMQVVMKALAPSFRTADGEGLLTGVSLKKAIQRELKKPDLADRVEAKREHYRNGRPMDLFRRRP